MAGGAVKELRAMQSYKEQKIVSSHACFCSATMLTSNIIPEIIEIILKFLGAWIAAINLFDLIKHEITCDTFIKSTSTPIAPLMKGQAPMPPSCTRSPASLIGRFQVGVNYEYFCL